ncbi:ion transporter [uncultured Pseudodesulfovibrio sp.]|uniref:ion transporter n=1 Tax=uncultured Pseudodesulfovibrio sp. TaxID=2035858 RepID=UPI0029C8AFCC|nr:ion transporter [uncultured Pseudodesulfovibrio sp.]
MPHTIKKKLYLLLEDQSNIEPRARWVRAFLVVLILLSVTTVIIETMEDISIAYRHIFRGFEYFFVAIFTVEYIARLWVCNHGCDKHSGILGYVKHALNPFMLVDLLAILPFYLPYFLPNDLIFLRAIRLMRLLRVLKLGRYSDAVQVFSSVVKLKKEQLAVAGFGLGILLIIASSLMYYFEREAQPAIFSSIPHAMWWAIITLTTVGYGDAYPITAMGRFLASFLALLGIAMFALPAGIMSAGFVEYGERKRNRKRKKCPNCGATIPPDDKT